MKAASLSFVLGVSLALSSAAQQQNVLIVIADDVGQDQLRLYGKGDDNANTPTINKLASQGVVFQNAWANPICSPSRAAIQTGRHGFRTGVGWLVEPGLPALPLSEVTLAELLDRGTGFGWSHAMIGKWHLGNESVGGALNPNLQGYDHFSGALGNLTSDTTGFSYTNWVKTVNGASSISNVYATTDQVNDAIAWITTAAEPWLCVLSFSAPHPPLHKPPDGLYTVNLENFQLGVGTGEPGLAAHKFYRAAIEALDTELGRLMTTVDSEVLARTNVLFLGDNGTAPIGVLKPNNYKKAKGTLFEGGVRVPLIVSGPAVVNPGRRAFDLVHVVDIFSTVANIAGFEAEDVLPAGTVLDSVSMMPILADTTGGGTAPLPGSIEFTMLVSPPAAPGNPFDSYAIRDGQYKLMTSTAWELDKFFDLKTDPFEVRNFVEIGFPSLEVQAIHDQLQADLAALLDS